MRNLIDLDLLTSKRSLCHQNILQVSKLKASSQVQKEHVFNSKTSLKEPSPKRIVSVIG